MTFDKPTPEERIDRYLLGQATANDIEVLNELLATDKQLRERYRFRVALEGGYRESAIRDDVDSMMDVALPRHTGDEPRKVDSRSMLYGAAVAACLAAVVLFLVSRGRFVDRESTAEQTSPETARSVARLVTSVDADWQAIDPVPGALLKAGSFQLESGIVELQFNRGARVRFRGPARFELKSPNELHVSSGSLVARIPEEAIGFTITTDEAEVVDLGTEFGLRVEDGRQTEVHVIEGLVEVFPREASTRAEESIRIEEGQAVRWTVSDVDAMESESIPMRSSRGLLGTRQRTDLGLTFLQGNIRLKETVSAMDLTRPASSWIEVIPERRGVLLDEDLPVTLVSPGNYRVFGDAGQVIPAGTKVDSYLFHFRSAELSPIQGVIQFDREMVGLVCEAKQLAGSDQIFGQSGVRYPVASKQYRGLEPRVRFDNPNADKGGGWTSDEVTVSNDMKTLGLRVNVNPVQGVDQLRILVLSKDQP